MKPADHEKCTFYSMKSERLFYKESHINQKNKQFGIVIFCFKRNLSFEWPSSFLIFEAQVWSKIVVKLVK